MIDPLSHFSGAGRSVPPTAVSCPPALEKYFYSIIFYMNILQVLFFIALFLAASVVRYVRKAKLAFIALLPVTSSGLRHLSVQSVIRPGHPPGSDFHTRLDRLPHKQGRVRVFKRLFKTDSVLRFSYCVQHHRENCSLILR